MTPIKRTYTYPRTSAVMINVGFLAETLFKPLYLNHSNRNVDIYI